MRKSLLLVTFLFASFPFFGQNLKSIDSLMRVVRLADSKEVRVDCYVEIAQEYSVSDSSHSQKFISMALSLADSIGYDEGKANALYVIAYNSMLNGDYEKASRDVANLMELVEEIDYQKGKASGLFAMAWLNYYRGNYEESIEYHNESLAIRNELGNRKDIANSLRSLGITYKLIGNFDRALGFLTQSLEIEKEIFNRSGIAECLNHIGIINGLRGDYPSALESHLQALESQKTVDDKRGMAYTYQNIGFVHYRRDDYDRTIEFYERSLELRKELGETRGMAQVTYYLGVVYHEKGEYGKALDFYLNAMDMKSQLGDKRGTADVSLAIGRLYADQGNYKDAIDNQLKSLEISESINSDWGKVNALIGLGESHTYLEKYKEAKEFLVNGIELAKTAKLLENIRAGAKMLAEVESALGHYKDAYEAQILYQQVSDSLSNESITERIALIEAENRFNQEKDSIQFVNEREKLILDQKISYQRRTQLVYFIVLFVLLALLVILFRFFQLRTNANRRLSLLNREINYRNESLRQLNEEKNNLINMVAHDLKNPVANIMSSIGLIQIDTRNKEQKKIKEIIEETTSRMWAMISGILNVEAIERNIEEIEVSPHNISEIIKQLSNQLSQQAAKKNITFQLSIEPDLIALIDERYVAQIVENLLSNAIKFSPGDTTVEIRLFINMRRRIILEIQDHGPGLSEKDQAKLFQQFQRLSAKPTGNESSTGMGLFIVKKLVEKMNGRVWAESALGEGASFFVEFQSA